MDIQLFSDKLRESLNEKAAQFNPETDDLFKLGQLLNHVRDAILELKVFVNKYTFQDEQEEIHFFRHIKPGFISEYLYYKKLLALRLFDSFRDHDTRQLNYQAELKRLQLHAVRHKEFYEYCLKGSTDLDHRYFRLGSKDDDLLERDEKFSTGHDTRVARMLANEMISRHLHRKINEDPLDAPGSGLTWTESKVALIELIYALHATQVFNDGSAEIKPIALAFERCFNISLGNYYRVFQDIRLRKGSTTGFLDQLRKKLQANIDNSNQ